MASTSVQVAGRRVVPLAGMPCSLLHGSLGIWGEGSSFVRSVVSYWSVRGQGIGQLAL